MNGNVFVVDSGSTRIDVFSAKGVFEGAFGWGVVVSGLFGGHLCGFRNPISDGAFKENFGLVAERR